MQSKNKLGAAIVGCRAVSPLHAQAIKNASNVELVAVCDIEREPVLELGKNFGAEICFSYEEVLSRRDVDIVYVVTPDELHAEMAVAAAKAGKHAMVEKPIAMNLQDIDEIMTASQQHNVKIMCAQSMRFRHKFRAVRESVESGIIGDPVFVRIGGPASPYWSPGLWQSKGYRRTRGIEWLLIHNGMHNFDYLSLLFGCFPREVYAVSHPGHDWLKTHEYVGVSILFENGAMALSEENRIMQPAGYPFHCDLLVVGTSGTIQAGDRQTFSMCSFTEDGLQFPDANIGSDEAEDAFTRETQALVDAILDDEEPEIPLSFSRSVLNALMKACDSLSSSNNETTTEFH